ncbi:hypothetical protein [Pseudomonas luteola]|nr:hypothetical protein [Pseudomonas luteola]
MSDRTVKMYANQARRWNKTGLAFLADGFLEDAQECFAERDLRME